MQHLIIFLLGLIVTFNLSAQSNKRILQLSGTISGKYPIKMTLTVQNDKVLGYYYYEKYKTKVLLEGQKENEKLILKESPISEFEGGFSGELRDHSFKGMWTDKQNNKTLNFQAVVDSDKLMIANEQAKRAEGLYNNRLNSDRFTGRVTLTQIYNDIFLFEISNGTESGCEGYLKGLVSLTNFSKGSYAGDQCKEIGFTLLDNKLTIVEESCELHGVQCPFRGEYQKK